MKFLSRYTFFIAAALSGCLFFPSCSNDIQQVNAFFEQKTGVDEAIDMESYMSQGGKMKARLRSPLMLRYQDTLPRMEFPKTLHVDFFDSSLQVQSQVDARFARYLEALNRILLKDSVRVFNLQGDTLFCQELWWEQNAMEFHTDKPVRIHRPGMIINGVGLKAPQDFKTFTIFQITNSVLRVRDEPSGMTDTVAATGAPVAPER
jgi:LPS export ABC transporter protein LptC